MTLSQWKGLTLPEKAEMTEMSTVSGKTQLRERSFQRRMMSVIQSFLLQESMIGHLPALVILDKNIHSYREKREHERLRIYVCTLHQPLCTKL